MRASLEVGELLRDRYEILETLREAPSRKVYRARDRRWNRDVALDVFANDAVMPSGLTSAAWESSVLDRLRGQPHVAAVIDDWEDDGAAYMVTRFFSGGRLSERIARSGRSGEELSVDRILEIALEIARGLAYVHEARLVHLDLQPWNVLLDDWGHVHLVDFDAAVALDDDDLNNVSVPAPIEYVAPEVAAGEAIDERADLYSLGATLFELCDGRRPYTGSHDEIIRARAAGPAPAIRRGDVPEELSNLVSRLLSVDPRKRPASADEVVKCLESLRAIRASDETAIPSKVAWVEQLPFPLSGVARMYLAVSPASDKVDHLLHFFEAYAIFIVTTLLSSVGRDPQTYQETVAKVKSGCDQSHTSILDRADFGTCINLGRTVAGRVRVRLGVDRSGEIQTILFGSLSREFVDALVARDFWVVLDSARDIRNEIQHGGTEGAAWVKRTLSRLEALFDELRSLAPHTFATVDLVRPGKAEQNANGLFIFDRAECLMGSNPMFGEREVQSKTPMLGQSLYLVPKSEVADNPMRLLPLIQMRHVPETEDRAVYYYSRRLKPDEGVGFRFVSYHFGGHPVEKVEDSDLARLIEDLTTE